MGQSDHEYCFGWLRGTTQQATDRSRKGPRYRPCGLKLEQAGGTGSPAELGASGRHWEPHILDLDIVYAALE